MAAERRRSHHSRRHPGLRAQRLPDDVEERNLADRGRDPPVRRRGGQGVAAAHRRAEGRHPVGIDPGKGTGAGDRGSPVGKLPGRVEQVLLAAAVAEAPVVEDERRDPDSGETLGECPEPVSARPGEAMRHHHDRSELSLAGRLIEPGGALVAA
jgi:hypothetical protein